MKKEDIEEILRLHSTYTSMIRRCYSKKAQAYYQYGERGIYVCEEWRASPSTFIEWAIANGSSRGLHLDRIDNDGPYSPENCRFVTVTDNNNNRSSTKFATAFGETKPLGEWAIDIRCKVAYPTLYSRIIKSGWNHERAISEPSVRHGII